MVRNCHFVSFVIMHGVYVVFHAAIVAHRMEPAYWYLHMELVNLVSDGDDGILYLIGNA